MQNTEGAMFDTTNQMKMENQIPQIINNYNHQVPATQYQISTANQGQYAVPQANPPQAAPGVVYALPQNGSQPVVDPNNISVQPVPVQHAAPSQAKTQPTYVNAKQYHRIIKRREARRKLDEFYLKKRKQVREDRAKDAGMKRSRAEGTESPGSEGPDGGRRAYIHESRHKHAMKRPRGPGGRFLTKDELVEYYTLHPEEDPNKIYRK